MVKRSEYKCSRSSVLLTVTTVIMLVLMRHGVMDGTSNPTSTRHLVLALRGLLGAQNQLFIYLLSSCASAVLIVCRYVRMSDFSFRDPHSPEWQSSETWKPATDVDRDDACKGEIVPTAQFYKPWKHAEL